MKEIELPAAWRGRAKVVTGQASDQWLSDSERAMADLLRFPKRRAEWVLSRMAAKQLAVEQGLCSAPPHCTIDRPRIVVDGKVLAAHVSISHSSGYAAAAIDARPVGVDVERFRVIRQAAAHLFLTEDEAAAAEACRLDNVLLHFWAAKEAAWKQQEGAIETLKRVPLKLEAETAIGLRFDIVETMVIGEVVVALTRPTS